VSSGTFLVASMARGAAQRSAAMMSRDMDAGVDLIGARSVVGVNGDRVVPTGPIDAQSARSASGGYNRILRLELGRARSI
jgi:hypothetical protein